MATADEPTDAVEQVGEEEEAEPEASLKPALPVGKVKRIIRVDRDTRKVTGEAALLIATATELFLGSLVAGAHMAAARAHRPTVDVLLDCLPAAEEAPRARSAAGAYGGGGEAKPLPRGTRRINAFFIKVT